MVSPSDTPQFCPNFRAILVAETASGDYLCVRTRCKMWSCPYCAKQNQKTWRARIINHIQNVRGQWTWFTLTAHSKKRGAQSLENLRKAWDTLVKRMKRRYGKFQYCRVYERHADGSYHLHAIGSFHFGDIKERRAKKDGTRTKYSVWLKKNAADLKLGYYTHADDIEISHSGYIASYVTKYMTKFSDNQKRELGRIRHIQVSQGWLKFEDDKTLDWAMKSAIFINDYESAWRKGKSITDIQTGEKLSWDTFEEHIMYPHEFAEQFDKWNDANKL